MATSFGVTSTGGYGILQSLSETGTPEIAEARAATGKVQEMKAYSVTKEATAEGIFDGDSIAEPGTQLAVGSVTGLITNIQTNETNTDFKRVSVTVQKKDAATLSAYS
jgi:hypothetical protein